MNDLDSRLRAWNPVRAEDVSDAASSAAAARLLQLVLAQAVTGHTRLVAAGTGQGRADRRHSAAGRPFPRWRIAVALASAAAITAGTAYALTAPASGPAQATVPQEATLAAKILAAAAARVARGAATAEPSPGQWIYSAVYVRGQRRAGAVPAASGPLWLTFDGDQQAYYKDGTSGPLIVDTISTSFPPPGTNPWVALNTYGPSPMTAWDVLAALPVDPHALLAVITHKVATPAGKRFAIGTAVVLLGDGGAPATEPQLEFSYLTELLWNTAGPYVPAPAEAAVYRAMATLPGITVQQGITNAAGAPAIGISDNGGYNQLLLSPVTYQVTGLRVISDGISRPGWPWHPKGTLLISLASTQVTKVAGPGDR
jgi:hypothetical protein